MKSITNEEVTIILKAVNAHPDGASLSQIQENLAQVMVIPKRTLQRHLANLVESDQLTSVGKNRARLYLMPTSKNEVVKKQIHYQRSFVDNYEPNVTYYLSAAERSQLLQWGTPPKIPNQTGTFTNKILQEFLLDLSWNSSRLEGNTYSLLETQRLLNTGEIAENKNPMDAQMLLNHKAAIEFLLDQGDTLRINRPTILTLHGLLSENLLGNPASCGRLRDIPVGIGKTLYVPLAVPQLIDEMFRTILEKAQKVQDPFEQSFFLMVHLPYLQPFEDVNKRVSRLSANIPLLRDDLCPLSFIDVSENAYIGATLSVYEFNRIKLLKQVYLEAYERSCKRYSTMQQQIGQPELIYLKYQEQIKIIIRAIILKPMDPPQTIAHIEQEAAAIPDNERQKFIEVIDNALMGLHPGNIAQFKVSQDEYESWKKNWQ
jgi:Fic family protein